MFYNVLHLKPFDQPWKWNFSAQVARQIVKIRVLKFSNPSPQDDHGKVQGLQSMRLIGLMQPKRLLTRQVWTKVGKG
jgi:hypothetical protein